MAQTLGQGRHAGGVRRPPGQSSLERGQQGRGRWHLGIRGRQIDDRGYAIPYEADGRKVVKVGINVSSEERTISDWKIIEL